MTQVGTEEGCGSCGAHSVPHASGDRRRPRCPGHGPGELSHVTLAQDNPQRVLVKVDEGLTVEVRAVQPPAPAKKTLGDLLREIGRWEGESGAELDALFTRRRGNRQVPDLP